MSGGQGEAVHDFVGLHRVGIADAHEDEDVEDAFGRQALSAAVPSGAAMLPHRRPYRTSMFAGNDVLHGRFRERHLRSHALRMFAAQMPIYFQRQHSAVTMPQPTRDGWNINPTLNAASRKKVSQGVVRQPSTTDKPARPGQSALAF